MSSTTITVTAAPGRAVPIPLAAMRSPTGAAVVLVDQADAGKLRRAEIVGPLELDLRDSRIAHYIRRRLAAGDLIRVEPAAPAPTITTSAPASPAKDGTP